KCLIEITQVDREINKNFRVLDFLFDNKNGSELEFTFLKAIIYHFADTKSKKEFDNLEVSIMQSRLNVKNYENFVSISGKVKFPEKMGDATQSLSSSPNNSNNEIEDTGDGNNKLSFI